MLHDKSLVDVVVILLTHVVAVVVTLGVAELSAFLFLLLYEVHSFLFRPVFHIIFLHLVKKLNDLGSW